MVPGMVISATTPSGEMTITATDRYTRRYAWNGWEKTFTQRPRSRRWLGSHGLYRPTGDRDLHAILEEGQQHFYSEEEALAWLAWQQLRVKSTYSADGLVVGWFESRSESTPKRAFVAEVWQLYIRGAKPTRLRGASNGQIDVRPVQAIPAPATLPLNTPQTINDREYAGKALDYMAELGISADEVERVIAEGDGSPRGQYVWYHGWYLEPRMKFAVCVDSAGKVWLVVP